MLRTQEQEALASVGAFCFTSNAGFINADFIKARY
jgi:hypothetical protein